MSDGKPLYAFVNCGTEIDPAYPYHVLIGDVVLFKSRLANKARNVAECVRGQFWRTPLNPNYPKFVLCNFERESWQH